MEMESVTDSSGFEEFWVSQLRRYEPTVFTRQKLVSSIHEASDDPSAITVQAVILELPSVNYPAEARMKLTSLASFITFVARICCADTVHLAIVPNLKDVNVLQRQHYSYTCPGIFDLDLHSTRDATFEKCFEALEKMVKAGVFLRDVFYRYQDLRERRDELGNNLVVAAVNNVHEPDECVPVKDILADSQFLVLLSPREMRIMYHADPARGPSLVVETLKYYPLYLTSLFALRPTDSLLETQILSPDDRLRLYPVPKPVGEQPDLFTLFVTQVHHSPDSVALATTQGQLTYSETLQAVFDFVKKLELHLPQSSGLGKQCIGLHLPKSMAYVLSSLACIRAGRPFLPLPVDLPGDRLVFTLQDAHAEVVITDEQVLASSEFQSLLPGTSILFKTVLGDRNLVVLNVLFRESEKPESLRSRTDLEEPVSSVSLHDDCCYVIYTSGSTGRPKGVQVKLLGVVNMCRALISALDLKSTDVTAQFASIGFDTSIWEIFPALLSGGTLAILQENQRLGKEFAEAVAELKANIISLTPSVLNISNPEDFPTLEKIIAVGETCMLSTAIRWTRRRGEDSRCPVRFYNSYGPAETTVGATIYEFQMEDYADAANQELAIGKAMSGLEVYVFDDFMKPVPPRMVGEIYIGGAGVSGGYIGHAAKLNPSRFVPNPLASVNDPCPSLLYKTGDHAFQDKNGRLTFLGRLDDQVKIRGKRVSLGEIEQVLMQNVQVEFAVVVQHRCEASQEPTLAAFVSPSTVSVDDLKTHLSRAVPAYMIPTYIKTMDIEDFPRSIHGKVNRKVLEADESIHDLQNNASERQINETQLAVVGIFKEILCLDDATVSSMHPLSSFTALGGNSLHLVLLQRKFEITFNLHVSVDDLVAVDTVEDIADVISRKKRLLEASGPGDQKGLTEQDLRKDILRDCHLNLDDDLNSGPVLDTTQTTDLHPSGGVSAKNDFITNRRGVFRDLTRDYKCCCGIPDRSLGEHEVVSEPVATKHSMKTVDDALRYDLVENGHTADISVDKNLHVSEDSSETVLSPLTVLFSGATGFIGAFLLDELLRQTNARVLCMVRGNSRSHGFERVVGNMRKYGLWKESYSMRVEILLCDLSRPGLGMTEDVYRTVCKDVDVVLMNAARINFNTSYYDHRKVNVLGTRELIRVAMTGRQKFLFLVSSLSVLLFPAAREQSSRLVLRESDVLDDPLLVEGGYGQSKWVSEKLVLQALHHLPGGAIFRPGNVTGRSTDGVGPRDDVFSRYLIGMRDMGSFPGVDFPVDMLPVDFCARAMVEIVRNVTDSTTIPHSPHGKLQTALRDPKLQAVSPLPRVYHLYNKDTIPFKDLFVGSGLRAVPLDDWRRELREMKDNPHLLPLTPFFMSHFWERAPCTPFFCTCNTDNQISLETARLVRPARELLALYKRFLGIPE